MSLFLYDTRTRSKRLFSPINKNQINLYVCGPTVYDRPHLGNARSIVVFDLLYRLLKHLYPSVCYVRNVTDVDDKIIRAAQAKKCTIETLTTNVLHAFHQDIKSLGVLPPTHEPKATEHITQMIQAIENLIQKGFAYSAEGHVMFHVKHYNNYGLLSGKRKEDQRAGARVTIASYKKSPEDFILWKPAKNTEPRWDSPWGYGRPGWHIECSAMSRHYFSLPFDIHGGGQDLIFPHHENEIAQSCCAYDTHVLANFWVHNGILVVEGDKMSKSLGNFLTISEALSKWSGDVIRWALLSAHYRQPLDWKEEILIQTEKNLNRIKKTVACSEKTTLDSLVVDPFVLAALQDDMNTPKAFARLSVLANNVRKEKNLKKQKQAIHILRNTLAFLGFNSFMQEQHLEKSEKKEVSLSPYLNDLIEKRKKAREQKDFRQADELRKELLSHGIVIKDTPSGTSWEKI